jgi:hypothetical protein
MPELSSLRAQSLRWRFVPAAAAILFLLAASRLAYFRMFAQFVAYDDEGYVLQPYAER